MESDLSSLTGSPSALPQDTYASFPESRYLPYEVWSCDECLRSDIRTSHTHCPRCGAQRQSTPAAHFSQSSHTSPPEEESKLTMLLSSATKLIMAKRTTFPTQLNEVHKQERKKSDTKVQATAKRSEELVHRLALPRRKTVSNQALTLFRELSPGP